VDIGWYDSRLSRSVFFSPPARRDRFHGDGAMPCGTPWTPTKRQSAFQMAFHGIPRPIRRALYGGVDLCVLAFDDDPPRVWDIRDNPACLVSIFAWIVGITKVDPHFRDIVSETTQGSTEAFLHGISQSRVCFNAAIPDV
jgi:hypothetical protein